MNDSFKNTGLWIVVLVLLGYLFIMFSSSLSPGPEASKLIDYSAFIEHANNGKIKTVNLQEGKLKYSTIDPEGHFETWLPPPYYLSDSVMGKLTDKHVRITATPIPERQGFLMNIFVAFFPYLILIGIWVFFVRQIQGGGGKGGALSFGRSRARLLDEDQVRITFADVAGVDEAKAEVSELVDFLRDPKKFQNLGGRIPRGVLMVGPPGTGKTLLAKAIAGEAKVPFFSISGSDFVEMFVGVGASRVRDMFEQAKKHAPCIIFIDEIDAVGRHRGAGLGGGHDEREQTLNQLLVEMDGFEGNEGVIVISATNRLDVLDPALLRPGRFDRQVVVSLPDIRGREQILKVHTKKVPLNSSFNAKILARGTPGFSGADLANLVNEASLFAARTNRKAVDMECFEHAKDKIMMGVERRSMVMSEESKKLTAYHEAGHAIVGLSVKDHDPVYKVTIIPRGGALGLTMFLPEDDRYSYSKQRLESQIASLFGGRIAEELIFGPSKVTTGASDDIRRATNMARNMVTRWGLSARLGPLTYGEEEGEVFLGHSMAKRKEISDETVQIIDEEIRRIIDENYALAKQILTSKLPVLHAMADALLKYETINSEQIQDIMDGREPRVPQDWTLEDPPQTRAGTGAASSNSKANKNQDQASIVGGASMGDPLEEVH